MPLAGLFSSFVIGLFLISPLWTLPTEIRSELETGFSGVVCDASVNQSCHELLHIHNGLCRHIRPEVIVQPKSTEDVAHVVRVAQAHRIPLSVKSGGHSYTCESVKSQGIHIDLKYLNKIEILSPQRLLLGPGNTWNRVLEQVPPSNYTYVYGQCKSVGVGGYLVGGGYNINGLTHMYGMGSENVLQYTVVTPEGDIVYIRKDNTTLLRHSPRRVEQVADFPDLFHFMGRVGSSLGIVTEFEYAMIPKAQPRSFVALGYLETLEDLRNLDRALLDPNFSIVVYHSYPFYRSGVPWNYPSLLKMYYMLHVVRYIHWREAHVMIMLISDGSGSTSEAVALRFAQKYGLKLHVDMMSRMVQSWDMTMYDYETMYLTPEDLETSGYRAMASANFIATTAVSPILDEFLLEHPIFNLLEMVPAQSSKSGCEFCFLAIASTPKRSAADPDLTQSHIGIELSCMYDPQTGRRCPTTLEHVKQNWNRKAKANGVELRQYRNTPTCDKDSHFGPRYFGKSYDQMVKLKHAWDPRNVFHHCQSVGSNDTDCCPVPI